MSAARSYVRGQVERNKRGTWLQALWYLNDTAAILAGFAVGYLLRFASPIASWIPPVDQVPPFDIYLLAAVVAVLLWVPMFQTMGLYRLRRGRWRHARRDLVRGLLFGVLVLAAVGFFYRGASFSRLATVLIWSATCVFLLVGRSAIQIWVRRWAKVRPIRFATVGRSGAGNQLIKALRRSSVPHVHAGFFSTGAPGDGPPWEVPAVAGGGTSGYTLDPDDRDSDPWDAGALGRGGGTGWSTGPGTRPNAGAGTREAGSPSTATALGSMPEHCVSEAVPHAPGRELREGDRSAAYLGSVDQIRMAASRLELDLVVLVAPQDSPDLLREVYLQCQALDLDFQFVPGLLSLWVRPVRVEEVDGMPVLRLRELPLVGWNGVLKRALDLLFSTVLLLLLAPLFAVLALAVRLDSPGPIFLRQERVGRDRRPFPMLKFRSMREDAESATGPIWAASDDPRRTRVGTFLRKWSLDELPQLLNVLAGQMSLVGPRPERPFFVHQFESQVDDYYDRHRIKSGVTGWAQVHGLRGQVPIEQRTRYDLYYIENWSLWLDLRILWMTLSAVVRHRGA